MMEFVKSLRWVDYFYFIFTDPRRLAELVQKEEAQSLGVGLAGLAFLSLAEILSTSLLGAETLFFYTKISYGWLFTLLMLLLAVVISSALIDSTAQLLGSPGAVRQTIAVISLALFPRALLFPAVFIFRLVHFAPVFFYSFLSFVVFLWSAYIIVTSISQVYSTNLSRSAAIFVLPFVFLGIHFFFTFLLLVVTIVEYFSVL